MYNFEKKLLLWNNKFGVIFMSNPISFLQGHILFFFALVMLYIKFKDWKPGEKSAKGEFFLREKLFHILQVEEVTGETEELFVMEA